MRCAFEPDPRSFARVVLPWLERDPVRNNVLCTVIEQGGQDCLWCRLVNDHGVTTAVAVQTPPRGLLISELPSGGAAVLAAALDGRDLPTVDGPPDDVRAFVEAWPTPGELAMSQRIYQLDEVNPADTRGELRPARPFEAPLLEGWVLGFNADAGQPRLDRAAAQDQVRRRLAAGQLWVWEADGHPVSLAANAQPVAGVVRISLVYTPPEYRGMGYASGCVAALSQLMLDRGAKSCMLYTDLANPTSNAVYQRIGYYPVADAESWRLLPTGG